jgi:guanine deaminase
MPGFVDTHVHYPQTDIIAAYGEQLLEWLERYIPDRAALRRPGVRARSRRLLS